MDGKPNHPYALTVILASVPVQAALMFTTAALAVTAFAQHSQAVSYQVAPNVTPVSVACGLVLPGKVPASAGGIMVTPAQASDGTIAGEPVKFGPSGAMPPAGAIKVCSVITAKSAG